MRTRLGIFSVVAALIGAQLSSAWAAETGLAIGNQLTSVPIRGSVIVTCSGTEGQTTVYPECRRVLLDPNEFSAFVTTPGGQADKVTLTATHEDGSTRTKSESFDPSQGKSKGKFNLWIATLLQRPLLEPGMNRVHYALSKGNRVESEGDFTVTITPGGARTCRMEHIFSSIMSDCTGTNICDQYFRQQNWCQ